MSSKKGVLFVSDLHLSLVRPAQLALFKSLLLTAAKQAKQLYILGDLFEDFWVGADDLSPPIQEINEALKAYASHKDTALFVMRGNRDFYLDAQFAALTGCTLLADSSVIELDGERVLLMHGDILCTDDKSYQYYRACVASRFAQQIFSMFPLLLRRGLSHKLRGWIRKTSVKKPANIVDVNTHAVREVMTQQAVRYLIHGHTHNPGRHELSLVDRLGERFVLGDWYNTAQVLVYQAGAFHMMAPEEYICSARL